MIKTVDKTEHVDVVVFPQAPGILSAMLHQRTQLDPRAQVAQSLACAFASANPSASPTRIAEDACNTASKLFEQFKRLGWTVQMPSFEELQAMTEGTTHGQAS